jgi:uncharacterized protein YlxW (UPF0749 family)
MDAKDLQPLRDRLKELNTKAYYLLVALSFVYSKNPTRSLKWGLTLTALVAVLPVQDYFGSELALNIIRCLKVALLTAAMIFTLVWVWSSATATAAAAQQKPAPPSATAAAAPAQQKPAPSSPQSQAQLEEHVKELEKRLDAAEQKAGSAAMEKDYITRVQKQYETYYEKVLSTQSWTLAIFGLILSALLIGASIFSFNVFDSRTKSALDAALAQLRTEFTQLLEKETKTLLDANDARLKVLETALTEKITELDKDLQIRSRFQFDFAQGLAASAANAYADSRASFRRALKSYKSGKPRNLFKERQGALAVVNLFVAIANEDKPRFQENAREELANNFYDDLEVELALAAVWDTDLAPLVKDRKSPPSGPTVAQPTIRDEEPPSPPPSGPDDDK